MNSQESGHKNVRSMFEGFELGKRLRDRRQWLFKRWLEKGKHGGDTGLLSSKTRRSSMMPVHDITTTVGWIRSTGIHLRPSKTCIFPMAFVDEVAPTCGQSMRQSPCYKVYFGGGTRRRCLSKSLKLDMKRYGSLRRAPTSTR